MNTPLFSAVQGFVRLVTEYQEKGRQHVLGTHGLELSDWERGVLNALNTQPSGRLPFAALRKELARNLKRSEVHASTVSQLIERLGSGPTKKEKKRRGLVETTTVGARQDEETAVDGAPGIPKRKARTLSVSLTALGRRVAEALAEADEFPFAFMAKTIESFPDAEKFRQILQDAARGFSARAQRGTPAGVYDCFLHGENHSVIDYEAASLIIDKHPMVHRAAIANRVFLRRAVQHLVTQGVSQFIDVGCGYPTVGNTHDVAHKFAPEARVVYVDNDPDVVDKSNKLLKLSCVPYAKAIRGDLTNPSEIIINAVATGLIQREHPVGVILVAVLHFIMDEGKPSGMTTALKVMRTIRESLLQQFPKSFIAVSHALDDDRGLTQDLIAPFTQLVAPACCRTWQQISELLEGIKLDEPLNYTSEWHRDIPDPYPVLGYTPIESYEKQASMALAAVGQVV
jgi:hypothetical protein